MISTSDLLSPIGSMAGWLNMAQGLRSTRSQCSQYVQAGSTMSEYFAVHVHHGSTVTMKSMAGMTSLMMRLESGLMLMKFELAIHRKSMGTGSWFTAAAYTLEDGTRFAFFPVSDQSVKSYTGPV